MPRNKYGRRFPSQVKSKRAAISKARLSRWNSSNAEMDQKRPYTNENNSGECETIVEKEKQSDLRMETEDRPCKSESENNLEDPPTLKGDFSRNALESFELANTIYIKSEVLTDDTEDEANSYFAGEGVDEYTEKSHCDGVPPVGRDSTEFTTVQPGWNSVIKEEPLTNENDVESSGEYPLHIKGTDPLSKSQKKCPQCGRTYKTVNHLKVHMVHKHSGKKNQLPSSLNPSTGNIVNSHSTDDRKKVKCSDCDRHFSDTKSLKRHAYAHSANAPVDYFCYLCSELISKNCSFTNHIINNHLTDRNGEIKCPLCGRSYTYTGNLVWHLKHKHSPNGPIRYICDYCKNSFAKKGYLADHIINNHLTDCRKEIECVECNRRYCSMGNFRRHMKKVHSSIV